MSKSLIRTLAALVAATAASLPVAARHLSVDASREIIALNDGGTLYVFTDGKMAKEDRWGRPTSQPVGTVVVGADGRRITMTSNEVARLHGLFLQDHGN